MCLQEFLSKEHPKRAGAGDFTAKLDVVLEYLQWLYKYYQATHDGNPFHYVRKFKPAMTRLIDLQQWFPAAELESHPRYKLLYNELHQCERVNRDR